MRLTTTRKQYSAPQCTWMFQSYYIKLSCRITSTVDLLLKIYCRICRSALYTTCIPFVYTSLKQPSSWWLLFPCLITIIICGFRDESTSLLVFLNCQPSHYILHDHHWGIEIQYWNHRRIDRHDNNIMSFCGYIFLQIFILLKSRAVCP